MGRPDHALMSERIHPELTSRPSRTWEAPLVIGSVGLLSGLAVTDRLFAWLIGEFPTSSLLWHIRFEYLRPIAVYYDLAEFNLGASSPWAFSLLVITVGALIAGGALSQARLVRAISYHLFLGAAAVLVVLCFDTGLPIGARAVIGTPSEPYFLLGTLFASMAAILCLRIHAEYVGWSPQSSRILRRMRLSIANIRSDVEAAAVELLEQLSPAPDRSRAGLAFIRAERRRNHSSQ
jgi:hypothetical protein